jgi:hypothetical protein
MIMRRVMAVCAALFLALAMAPVAAAAVEEPGCWSASVKNEGWSGDRLLWTYTHTVTWCGDGTSITSVDPPVVEVDLLDKNCVWNGVTDAWSGPPRGWSASTFSEGNVVCRSEDTTTRGMNPWVILTIYANGTHDTDMGIA